MRKNTKRKTQMKFNYFYSIISSVILFLFITFVVLCVYLTFTLFVFRGIYGDNQKKGEQVNHLIEQHLTDNENQLKEYANGIATSINIQGLETDESRQSFIDGVYNIIGSNYTYTNIGIVMYDFRLDTSHMGKSLKNVESTKLYQNAVDSKFGTNCESIDNLNYITYTAPIFISNRIIGFVYATEGGNMSNGLYSFDKKNSTGILSCYILDSQNSIIGFCGNGNKDMYYDSVNKNMIFTEDDIQVEVELAQMAVGITSHTNISDWFQQYGKINKNDQIRMIELARGKDNYLLSKIWYKQPIGQTGMYTWIESQCYLENKTVVYLVGALGITILVLTVPFLILVISTILKIISNKKMSRILYMDEITGYDNWLSFQEKTEKIRKKRKNKDKKFALVSFEINKYRIIMDYYQNEYAIDVLKTISNELQNEIHKDEAFARYKESQFCLLLNYDNTEWLTNRVKNILNYLVQIMNETQISFRAGIFLIEDTTLTIDACNVIANSAKDICCESLNTQVVMYSAQIREKQLKERMIEDNMEKALKNGEFQVYLQPKFDPHTRKMAGAEALIRWKDPNKGMIYPGDFIPIFEKNGFITKIDDYMIEQVSKLQSEWIKQGKKVVPISVNVSRVHFNSDNLAEHILFLVEKYNIPHNVIELELTESAFFENKDYLLETVEKLHEFGFMVSMDDFGAGYSSLNSLKDLPLDIIKLDREFFVESSDPKRGEAVVKNTITLAKNLEMKIVAEGIETKAQVEFLEKQGCDMIQGFYYAKPMPVEEFEKMINEPQGDETTFLD